MKKVFVGIDFSKLTFDAVVLFDVESNVFIHQVFDNTPEGCALFVKWVKSLCKTPIKHWLVCGENTGLYSIELTQYLNKKNIDIWLESGLQVKLSMGIVRGKSDKSDAKQICIYCLRYQDRARLSKLRSDVLDQVKDLTAYKERLKKTIHILTVSSKELSRVKANQSVTYISEASNDTIKKLNSEIKIIDKKIKELLEKEDSLYTNFKLINTIKGIGFENSIMILILTDNFTLFSDPRKFACYSGVVPFKNETGTSKKGKEKVSSIANKNMKRLISNAACSAIQHDKKMREYYQKKIAQGKNVWIVQNNVKNKLIHLMFAVVRDQKEYNPDFEYKTANAA